MIFVFNELIHFILIEFYNTILRHWSYLFSNSFDAKRHAHFPSINMLKQVFMCGQKCFNSYSQNFSLKRKGCEQKR
jgi:hypothetical protein